MYIIHTYIHTYICIFVWVEGHKRFVSPARNYLLSVPVHNKSSMATCKYICSILLYPVTINGNKVGMLRFVQLLATDRERKKEREREKA